MVRENRRITVGDIEEASNVNHGSVYSAHVARHAKLARSKIS